jgi:osmosensitive K+ channel His kinase sensor protein
MTIDQGQRASRDALLALAKNEGRGKLKIFLGTAPGVDKTYAMLASAARAARILQLEEILDRARRGIGHVDLALAEAFAQLVRREIDEHNLIRLLEHTVRDGLADAHASDSLNDVVEALQVLDVQLVHTSMPGRDA